MDLRDLLDLLEIVEDQQVVPSHELDQAIKMIYRAIDDD